MLLVLSASPRLTRGGGTDSIALELSDLPAAGSSQERKGKICCPSSNRSIPVTGLVPGAQFAPVF